MPETNHMPRTTWQLEDHPLYVSGRHIRAGTDNVIQQIFEGSSTQLFPIRPITMKLSLLVVLPGAFARTFTVSDLWYMLIYCWEIDLTTLGSQFVQVHCLVCAAVPGYKHPISLTFMLCYFKGLRFLLI